MPGRSSPAACDSEASGGSAAPQSRDSRRENGRGQPWASCRAWGPRRQRNATAGARLRRAGLSRAQRRAEGGGEPESWYRNEGAGARREDGMRHFGRAGGPGVIGGSRGTPTFAGREAEGTPPPRCSAGHRAGTPRIGEEVGPGSGGGGVRRAAEERASSSGVCQGRPDGGSGWAFSLSRDRGHSMSVRLTLVVMGVRRRKRVWTGVCWGARGALKAAVSTHGAEAGPPTVRPASARREVLLQVEQSRNNVKLSSVFCYRVDSVVPKVHHQDNVVGKFV